jgi:ABC-type bacteriocin/lantibiotic exporter with double-glycine peptidase domain
LFAISGTTIYLFDIPTSIFPSLFQQVYTDNIITHMNPEWFTPLMALYVLLFVLELSIWILFSVVRRKSYAKIIIALSTKYIWTVLRLPMSLLSQFTPGELAASFTQWHMSVMMPTMVPLL